MRSQMVSRRDRKESQGEFEKRVPRRDRKGSRNEIEKSLTKRSHHWLGPGDFFTEKELTTWSSADVKTLLYLVVGELNERIVLLRQFRS